MNYYFEYPIRCKTCNGQIACFSFDYLSFLENNHGDTEVTLNEVGLMNPCCRIAMMTPSMVYQNVENRRAIEGLDTIEAASGSLEEEEMETTVKKGRGEEEGGEGGKEEDLGEGIPVDVKEVELMVPTIPSISTYNPDPANKPVVINVGPNHKTVIMDGRTFLAR